MKITFFEKGESIWTTETFQPNWQAFLGKGTDKLFTLTIDRQEKVITFVIINEKGAIEHYQIETDSGKELEEIFTAILKNKPGPQLSKIWYDGYSKVRYIVDKEGQIQISFYTGERDKNFKGIYTEDLLKFEGEKARGRVIQLHNGRWAALLFNSGGIIGQSPLDEITEKATVIGNIYQTPELMFSGEKRYYLKALGLLKERNYLNYNTSKNFFEFGSKEEIPEYKTKFAKTEIESLPEWFKGLEKELVDE